MIDVKTEMLPWQPTHPLAKATSSNNVRSISWLTSVRSADDWPYRWAKRILDVVIASIALLLLWPVLLLIAVAVRLDSPGPALFRQKRVGRWGREFVLYKFRSMRQNVDENELRAFAKQYINGHGGPNGQSLFKPHNDRHITRLGRFLRRTSLDELPQLINVLKGEMSLVGPRPVVAYEVAEYDSWHLRRLDVLPGITGLAQINGRSKLPWKEVVRLDIEYVEKCSFWLDLLILIKTIPVVFSTRSAG